MIQGTGNDKILVVPIEGVISEEGKANFLGTSKRDSILVSVKRQLDRAKKDPSIKAVILKINSPGGTVTASDIIYREILLFKQFTDIPVLAMFMDTAASGAYYIAMASDYISAHPTTVTGSIGVIIRGINFKEGLDKIGVKEQTFASGPNKNIGSPTSEMTPEQKAILQGVVNGLYDRFLEVVVSGRPKLKESRIRELADGRIYTANQALSNGLVDGIGYFQEAVKKTTELPNYRGTDSNPRIVTYTSQPSEFTNIYESSVLKGFGPDLKLLNRLLDSSSSAKFLYLWDF